MHLLEVDLMAVRRALLASSRWTWSQHEFTDNSSIDSCGGRGSSKPSPIISQVKLFCMGMALKSKVSGMVCGCGELVPLNCQRSGSARLMGGSGTLIEGIGGVLLVLGLARRSMVTGASSLAVVGVGSGSWVLSSVSTCSTFRACQYGCGTWLAQASVRHMSDRVAIAGRRHHEVE